MSALPITGPREERGAFFRLGQLGYKLGQAEADAREQLLKGLRDWNEDQKIPVCPSCGSPLVDWIAAASECGWRCQDCGAIEDRAGDGRRSAA